MFSSRGLPLCTLGGQFWNFSFHRNVFQKCPLFILTKIPPSREKCYQSVTAACKVLIVSRHSQISPILSFCSSSLPILFKRLLGLIVYYSSVNLWPCSVPSPVCVFLTGTSFLSLSLSLSLRIKPGWWLWWKMPLKLYLRCTANIFSSFVFYSFTGDKYFSPWRNITVSTVFKDRKQFLKCKQYRLIR